MNVNKNQVKQLLEAQPSGALFVGKKTQSIESLLRSGVVAIHVSIPNTNQSAPSANLPNADQRVSLIFPWLNVNQMFINILNPKCYQKKISALLEDQMLI